MHVCVYIERDSQTHKYIGHILIRLILLVELDYQRPMALQQFWNLLLFVSPSRKIPLPCCSRQAELCHPFKCSRPALDQFGLLRLVLKLKCFFTKRQHLDEVLATDCLISCYLTILLNNKDKTANTGCSFMSANLSLWQEKTSSFTEVL